MGTHRRQRSTSPAARGAAWVGLFLLLAAVAVLASRGLWGDLVAELLHLGSQSAPQGSVLWQAPCPPGSLLSVSADGRVLLAFPTSGGADTAASAATPRARIAEVSAGVTTVIGDVDGSVLAVSYYDRSPPATAAAAAVAGGAGGGPAPGEWRAIVVRDMVPTAPDQPVLLEEEVSRPGPGLGAAVLYRASGTVITAGHPWVDDALALLGAYDPSAGAEGKGSVLAVDDGGRVLWSRAVGPGPVHRLTARSGTGYVAAATPRLVALLDNRGNLLWSKTFREKVTDLALGSRGGPVVITGGELSVYDRRGNLIWRKRSREPLRAVACAAERIAVADAGGLVVYDEDGLERWSLACASAPVDLALAPTGDLAAVVLETGTLVLAGAPGAAPAGLETRPDGAHP